MSDQVVRAATINVLLIDLRHHLECRLNPFVADFGTRFYFLVIRTSVKSKDVEGVFCCYRHESARARPVDLLDN